MSNPFETTHYHVIFSRAITGALTVTVVPAPDETSNTLRTPTVKHNAPFTLAAAMRSLEYLTEVRFLNVTNFEDARRAVKDVVNRGGVKPTPLEVDINDSKYGANLLTSHQQELLCKTWNEPRVFRTVYQRDGVTDIFVRHPNVVTGRMISVSPNEPAVIGVHVDTAESLRTSHINLTDVVVIGQHLSENKALLEAEVLRALSKPTVHVSTIPSSSLGNLGDRLNVRVPPPAVPLITIPPIVTAAPEPIVTAEAAALAQMAVTPQAAPVAQPA